MTPARASLVALMNRYLQGLMDPFVTLLEVHKLMYFLQVSGEPLRLNYQKAHYGPYAENMRHLLREVEGHVVAGYLDGGDQPDKPLTLVPGAINDADQFLTDCPDTKVRLARVAQLVEGFESPFGLELLATVHWVASECPSPTVDEVIARTYAWGNRKSSFRNAKSRWPIGCLLPKVGYRSHQRGQSLELVDKIAKLVGSPSATTASRRCCRSTALPRPC